MKTPEKCLAVFALALIFNFCAPQMAWAASFIVTGSLNTARSGQTATLLQNGKVLVTGNAVAQTELYDPSTGVWTVTGPMVTARLGAATATLLTNGKVLVVGGQSYPQQQHFSLAAAELYDPSNGTWSATGSLATGRYGHTATLLTNGRVLVAGGFNTSGGALTSSEIYDPASQTWTTTPGSLATGREVHTATLLPNGKVLVAGGYNGSYLASAELFDPVAGTWTSLASLHTAHESHTATLLPNGKVLVAGGYNGSYLNGAELYDPGANSWTVAGAMGAPRLDPSATLLPNGTVLVAGGESTGLSFLSSAEVYNPNANSWSATASMSALRYDFTATLLPNGRVLVTGGANSGGGISESELYESASGAWMQSVSTNIPDGNTVTTTLLPNGQALVVGDQAAALLNPVTGTWTATGSMANFRILHHAATLLSNGKVLVTGGYGLSSAELYDPAVGTWAATGSMSTNRYLHGMVSLPNGKVLALGGTDTNNNYITSTELYDPATGIWTLTGPLSTGRDFVSAVLLPSGKVLVAGGYNGFPLSETELYDPTTGNWTVSGYMVVGRYEQTLTLLPNGNVLAAGGDFMGAFGATNAELYNPATQTWTLIGPMMTDHHDDFSAALLPNGKVLLMGGDSITGTKSEFYDPATGHWTLTASLNDYRSYSSALLLPNGRVLVAGGSAGYGNTAELYDVGLGFNSAWQPQIATVTSPLSLSNSLMLTGSQFRGIGEGSKGDAQDSPADYPVVQLRNLESAQTLVLPATNWSTNSFASVPVTNFPFGYAFATVFANGIPSQSGILLVYNPAHATVTLGNLSQTYDGTAKSVSLTISPPSLAVNLTYNGLASAPTNAGSYTVVATINDPTYSGGATNTLVIHPAPATMTLGNLLQSYTGVLNKNLVLVTTVPPGLAHSLTFNGLGFIPVNPGIYTVIGTITDPNYVGGATNTLTILMGLTLDTSRTVRTVDPRWYGLNTAIWDSDFDTDVTSNAMQEIGCRTLRFPGGSISDDYHWETGIRDDGYPYDPTKFSNFMHVATNAGVQVYITANYGSGTTNEAADWVRCANVTNLCGFKYWEVGNECYGSWERDLNTNTPYQAHDPWTYAMRFKDYYTAMKAADPTIKVGIMVTPGEDGYANGVTYVLNPRTGLYHSGWTPVVLATLQSLGITPNFAVHHVYPEYQVDNDATLLHASFQWAKDAGDLRGQIMDYFGPTGTNIELVCTENNADAGNQGRQSTSLVDALYLADSLGQISKTEFNSFVWWDLRNGPDTNGDFDPSLYGWRTNGDLGIMLGTDTRYPTYYGMKMMQYLAQPGDTILNPGSSDSSLAIYAAQTAAGAVNMLVINKDPSNTLTRPIELAGYTPNSLATIRSFGIPQDEATRTNSIVPGAQDIATNSFPTASGLFNYSFPPYSLTVLSLSPTAPAFMVMTPSGQSSNVFVFQLAGQPGVPYVLQTSSDLSHWTPIVTNKLAASVVSVTNPILPGTPKKFWRALWQP